MYISDNSQKVESFLYANQHVQGKCLDCDKASNIGPILLVLLLYRNQINKSWLIVIWSMYLGYLHVIQGKSWFMFDTTAVLYLHCNAMDLKIWISGCALETE